MRTVGSAGTMGTTARAAQAKNKFEQIVFEIEEFTEHVPVRDALVVVRWVRHLMEVREASVDDGVVQDQTTKYACLLLDQVQKRRLLVPFDTNPPTDGTICRLPSTLRIPDVGRVRARVRHCSTRYRLLWNKAFFSVRREQPFATRSAVPSAPAPSSSPLATSYQSATPKRPATCDVETDTTSPAPSSRSSSRDGRPDARHVAETNGTLRKGDSNSRRASSRRKSLSSLSSSSSSSSLNSTATLRHSRRRPVLENPAINLRTTAPPSTSSASSSSSSSGMPSRRGSRRSPVQRIGQNACAASPKTTRDAGTQTTGPRTSISVRRSSVPQATLLSSSSSSLSSSSDGGSVADDVDDDVKAVVPLNVSDAIRQARLDELAVERARVDRLRRELDIERGLQEAVQGDLDRALHDVDAADADLQRALNETRVLQVEVANAEQERRALEDVIRIGAERHADRIDDLMRHKRVLRHW